MKKLPNKPSELIHLALEDLEKAERSPKYKINMDDWHSPISSTRCEVCLAGAVMAGTMECDIGEFMGPSEFGQSRAKLSSLEYFRLGEVATALIKLGIKKPPQIQDNYKIISYQASHKKFKEDMMCLAFCLHGAGL